MNVNDKSCEKKYFAVMDVGGTKTIAAIADTDGNVIAVVRDRGITPVDAAKEQCFAHYGRVLNALYDKGDAAGVRVGVTYCSIATSEHYTPAMSDAILAAAGERTGKLRVEPDGMCLISGMLGHTDGAALICGTGSSLYVRGRGGFYRIGGWGHFIDSCGSGFVLGRLAIRSALRACDGRETPGPMAEAVNAHCGRPIQDDYDRIYSEGRAYVASYAGCVFEGRQKGDPAAKKIFDDCSGELAELVRTARRRIGRPFTLILNGGIFTHYPEYAAAVTAMSPTDVNVITGDSAPVYGCAVEAMYDLGLECGPEFRRRFTDGTA